MSTVRTTSNRALLSAEIIFEFWSFSFKQMRFFVDGTTLKILLQKHDRRIPIYIAPPIETVRYGTEREGKVEWEEEEISLIAPVKRRPLNVDSSILYEPSETHPHEFRATSEFGTVQNNNDLRGVDTPSTPTKTRTSYSLQTTRA